MRNENNDHGTNITSAGLLRGAVRVRVRVRVRARARAPQDDHANVTRTLRELLC
jgi:hypothetical protein